MAAAISTKKQRNDMVECSICCRVYNDPRSLPCVHSYCFKCIAEWCKDKMPGDQVACPLCRQDFFIPNGGVGDLPKKFTRGNLLKLNEMANSETGVKLCDICSADEENEHHDLKADVFCVECQQNICKPCKRYHSKMTILKTHTMISLDESESADNIKTMLAPRTFCDKHQNRQIEIYCIECKTTVCLMCYVTDHNAHKAADVAKVADDLRAQLTKNSQSLACAIRRFDEKLEDLTSARKDFITRSKKVESEICERANRLKALVNAEKHKLLADLHKLEANHEKEIDRITHEISQSKSFLESLNEYCTELVKKGSASEVIREADNLRRRTDELCDTQKIEAALKTSSVANVKFLPLSVTLDESTRFLGEVIIPDTQPAIPTLAHKWQGNQLIRAIALLNDQLFVIGVAQVLVYDKTSLQLQHQLKFREFSEDYLATYLA